MYWIECLASSEVNRMVGHWLNSLSTRAYPHIDAIHAAEERSLPGLPSSLRGTVNLRGVN